MTRSRSKQRKQNAGVKVSSFKSKTCASYYKCKNKYRKEKALGNSYTRNHAKRTELKRKLIQDLGLPMDTKFVFRYSLQDQPEQPERKILKIQTGTVVVINRKDLSIVMVVRCTPFKDMNSSLREKYNQSVSTTFQHARARNQCKIHCSLKHHDKEEGEHDDENMICGWMGCCGWRGGCEKGKTAGPYCISAFTSANIGRILTDKERMIEFHQIRDFWAEQFSSLSLSVFKTNLALGIQANIPGFDSLAWENTQNGLVFASNLVVTCEGFCNHSHTDKDHTRYAFGMWGMIIKASGQPYDMEKGVQVGGKMVKLGKLVGSRFCVDDFGVEVVLGVCNGMYDLLWDSTIPHYTTSSIAYDAEGNVVEHKSSAVTLYGSSCQISESLVQRIKLLGEKKRYD